MSTSQQRFLSVFGTQPATADGVDVLRNGVEIFPAMLEAIRSATSTIEFLTFVYWTGDIAQEFATALADQARRGVVVRVLVDSFGGRQMDPALWSRLEEAGCFCEWFRPFDFRHPWASCHRTHRKLLICDGTVGFTGGVGIAQEWCGDARSPDEWRDTHFRLTGSVVTPLRAAFWENWLEATGDNPYGLPVGTVAEGSGGSPAAVVTATSGASTNDIHAHFRMLIGSSERQINLTTGYFVPDDDLVGDLIGAARRNVHVRLLLPGPHTDKHFVRLAARSTMKRLADAGVEVFTYQPTMLHAKVLTVDAEVASIGSANLNHRSTNHDDEANVVLWDRSVVRTLDEHFDHDWDSSIPLAADELTDPRVADDLFERVLRPLRYFM